MLAHQVSVIVTWGHGMQYLDSIHAHLYCTPSIMTLKTPSCAAFTSSKAFSASSNLNLLVMSFFTSTFPEATRSIALG